MKEEKEGWIKNLKAASSNDIDKSILSPRFVIKQQKEGGVEKYSVIDNLKASGAYSTVS